MDVLLGRARRATEGRGSLVLVAGEAGIGKTVLLRTFADRMSGDRGGSGSVGRGSGDIGSGDISVVEVRRCTAGLCDAPGAR